MAKKKPKAKRTFTTQLYLTRGPDDEYTLRTLRWRRVGHAKQMHRAFRGLAWWFHKKHRSMSQRVEVTIKILY